MDGIKPVADFGLQMADLGREVRPASNAAVRSDEKKQRVAHDFESVLLTRLFDQVQQSLGKWDQEEDGTSQQVQGLFWFYLAREVADQGGVGLWKDIYRQLQQLDGAPNANFCVGDLDGAANPADVLNEEL